MIACSAVSRHITCYIAAGATVVTITSHHAPRTPSPASDTTATDAAALDAVIHTLLGQLPDVNGNA